MFNTESFHFKAYHAEINKYSIILVENKEYNFRPISFF